MGALPNGELALWVDFFLELVEHRSPRRQGAAARSSVLAHET
jgi:hypothetical protein